MLPSAVPFFQSLGKDSAIAPTRLCVRLSSVGCAASGGSVRSPVRPDTCRAKVFKYVKGSDPRSEEHTSELQSQSNLVCRLLLEKKKYDGTRPSRGVDYD